MPISRSAAAIASTASPSEAPGARLKLQRHRRELLLVRDHQRRGRACRCVAIALERHLRAVGAGHAQQSQRSRDRPARIRIGLEHHAVLVGLAVNGRDLPLAERIVERVVDRSASTRRAASPSSRSTLMQRAQAACSAVRGDVAQQRRGLQLLRKPRRPRSAPRSRRCPASVYWYWARLSCVPIWMSCTGWKKTGMPGIGATACLQPSTISVTNSRAVVARLQRDGEPAGVGRRIDRADADERDHAGHVRILADRVGHLRLQPAASRRRTLPGRLR